MLVLVHLSFWTKNPCKTTLRTKTTLNMDPNASAAPPVVAMPLDPSVQTLRHQQVMMQIDKRIAQNWSYALEVAMAQGYIDKESLCYNHLQTLIFQSKPLDNRI